jgi:hypothetical protein
MKSKEELEEEQLRMPPVFPRVERAFGRIPGVLGVGLGFKRTQDGWSETVAVTVTVEKKRRRRDLPASQIIPKFVDGIPTDIWEPIPSHAAASAALRGGMKLLSDRGEDGTLGCFGTVPGATANAPRRKVLLTCQHVIYDLPTETEAVGTVYSPDKSCCRPCATGDVANILRGVYGPDVDCAIAELYANQPTRQLIPGIGAVNKPESPDQILGIAPHKTVAGKQTPVIVGEFVRKVGFGTGPKRTKGKVFGINQPVAADGRLGPLSNFFFVHALFLPPHKESDSFLAGEKFHYCLDGDSGAVGLNDDNQIVGLLVRQLDVSGQGGDADDPKMGVGGGFCDIHAVMSRLSLQIPNSLEGTTGKTQTTGALMPGAQIHAARRFSPEDLAQRAAFETLKDELRGFPLGRRLVAAAQAHLPELISLVNHNRRAKVAWHRAKGPGFMIALRRAVMDLHVPMVRNLDGAVFEQGLTQVQRAVEPAASAELRADMAALEHPVMTALALSGTLREFIDNLEQVVFDG